jgi:hypothetical protein
VVSVVLRRSGDLGHDREAMWIPVGARREAASVPAQTQSAARVPLRAAQRMGQSMLSHILRGAAVGAAVILPVVVDPGAFAAASDYKFELASAQPAGPGKTDVTVRLVHVSDDMPIAGAVVFQSKADMGPSGMPTMPGDVKALPTQQAGLYRFQVDTAMAGTWALNLSAKVQGEAETVRQAVNFQAAK